MRVRLITVAAAAAAAVGVACKSDDKPVTSVTAPVSTIVTFKAAMAGAGEIPANTSTGSGTFTATLDTATNVFTYDITFSGLTSPVNNGHIHGPAFATANANIHTTQNPGGEIRGQIVKQ